MKKVVKGIYVFNFGEQVEFEGSTDAEPDVMRLGRGQSVQLRLQVGSVLDTETGEWSELKDDWSESVEVGTGNFGKAWDPVPPVDPQVVKAHEDAQKALEEQRAAAQKAHEEAQQNEEEQNGGFILP